MKFAASIKPMRGPSDLHVGAYGQQGYVQGFGAFEPEPLEQQRARLQQHAGKYDTTHGDDDDLGETDWMMTYTDMVTLLMAFFVILTAIATTSAKDRDGTVPNATQQIYGTGPSSPFDGRGFTIAEYGSPANADPIDSRYDDPDAEVSTTDPAPSGNTESGNLNPPGPHVADSSNPTPLQSNPLPQPPVVAPAVTPPQPQLDQSNAQNAALAQELQNMVQQNNLGSQVEVISGANTVTLRISEKILFPSGKASLETTGQALVQKLSAILANSGGMISIEGHTDNIPIATAQYPSNWELSAARASMVLRQLVSLGLPATKLRAIAYADTQPVAANSSVNGRATNRRVELVISSSPPAPPR